jgi:DNA-binding response OmpR family regulator
MKKILVVDDEALLVKGIRFNLQNEGYEVVTGSMDGISKEWNLNGEDVTIGVKRQ